jgi:bifunctional non-homologous end joining protein LigD
VSPSREAGVEVNVEGRRIVLRNLDKVFYPEAGFTKGHVVDYYSRIAPALLPHLRNRPITLKRYPEGVDGMFFYEKRCPKHAPAWIRTERIWSRHNADWIPFCVFDDLPSLVWAASIADLELHTYLHVAPEIGRPQFLVFDLDPGPPADVLACCEVALLVRGLLERIGLRAFPKTSGSKGLQLYVPLHGAVDYDRTKAFAHAIARVLEAARPDLVTSQMKKALRPGKVFVDWSQNDDHKTTACVYSLRARARPTVSTPVAWPELERALRRREPAALAFEAPEVLRRVERSGDLFAPVLTLRQSLPDAREVSRAGAR